VPIVLIDSHCVLPWPPAPSARGGGLHGQLAMLLGETDYITRVGVAFIAPLHPGPLSVAAGTAAIIAVALGANTDALETVTLYSNLRTGLTSLILTAVSDPFWSACFGGS
jgi:hypothetical protein